MSLGSNIKKLRYKLNLSQQELADLMGYKSRTTIAKIEAGENDVSYAKIQKFAKVLNTTFETLIAGTENTIYEVLDNNYIYNQVQKKQGNKNVVIILAAGKSVRNYQNIPNQFIQILNKPVISYCLEAYQAHPSIDDIYIVCLKGWENIVSSYANQYKISKLKKIITGGNTGIESIYLAFNEIKNEYKKEDIIIFQESTRPLITVDTISNLLQVCTLNGSATICHSMRDYVQFSVNKYGTKYLNRDFIVDLQSPEAHSFGRIEDVFKKAILQQHPMKESCCTLLMQNLGYKINFVEVDFNNIKIIRQEDIAIATALLKYKRI